jgi:uncharacterized protein YdaU (DUF1376 family)
MHFYPFHLADYAAHTRHLTPIEDVAYRRILDLYYLHERAPRGETEQIARLVNLREHATEVGSVLSEFFDLRDGAWINARAEEEIAAFAHRRDVAQRAGQASVASRRKQGKPEPSASVLGQSRDSLGTSTGQSRDTANGRSTDVQRTFNGRSTRVQRTFNAGSTGVEPTMNHEPRSITHEPPSEREIARAREPSEPEPRSRPHGRSLSPERETRVKGPLTAPRPEAPSPPSTVAIVALRASESATEAPSPPVPQTTAAPSAEVIIGWWVDAGLPRPDRTAVELVIDRAIRLRPERDEAWCRGYFNRIAKSPWCRGEVHEHPRCVVWSMGYAIGNERRIEDVLGGKYDAQAKSNAQAKRNEKSKPSTTDSRFYEVPVREAREEKKPATDREGSTEITEHDTIEPPVDAWEESPVQQLEGGW